MAAPTPAPYASASLYVGDLDKAVTEALLFEIFNAVGPVASVRICRDAATRRSLGYAYVNFHRTEDAERALDTMNFKQIRQHAIRIMWSHRDPSLRRSGVGNVFIKNLAPSIDNKTLYDTFSTIGNILSCKVATNDKGASLGYGFVHFETEEKAKFAITKVNGQLIGGKPVIVSQFKPKNERERVGAPREFTNIYVKNLPADVKKADVDSAFAKFGSITSSMVSYDQEGKGRGFGFINYETADQAKAAIDAMNGFDWGDKKLYVARHQSKQERERDLRQRWESKRAERQKTYPGVNLFVKNLSETVDDKKFTQAFDKFGSITSAKVMKDDQGNSKGFGFVCFSTPEAATEAVREMNGHMYEGKPLYVALAQRRDQRRQQLEAQHQARMAGFPMFQGQMFYGGGMPRGPMMYPQQMVPMQRPGWQGGPQQMVPGPGYQLMPFQGRGGGNQRGGRGRGGARGGRGGGRGGGAAGAGGDFQGSQGQTPQGQASPAPQPQGQPAGQNQAQGPAQGQQGQPRVQYQNNARNQGAGAPAAGAPGQQGRPAAQARGAPAQAAAPSAVVSGDHASFVKAVATQPEKTQKQMIGERLFPLVSKAQPQNAGKITGMLLEMDNGELISLLESKKALDDKIAEAVAVLNRADEEEDEEEDEEGEEEAE
jgi:polyadenylate-binding protein